MSDELYSNVLNDIVAILNEDTALSIDKKSMKLCVHL